MIYEEDVYEAMLFAPEVKPYESWESVNEITLMMAHRGVIPYIKRALVHKYGAFSTNGQFYVRYDSLIINFVGDANGLDPFNQSYLHEGSKLRPSISPVFYVRQKGERVGIEPEEVSLLITKLWSPLVHSVMSESDAWLTIRDNVSINGGLAQWR